MAFPSLKRSTPRWLLATSFAWAATAVLLTLPVAAFAEEDPDSPLRAGAWAAEFEVNPLFDFGSGSATLALKHHSSPGHALRLGVNASFRESKGDGTGEDVRFDPPYYPVTTAQTTTTSQHDEVHTYIAFLHVVREWPVRDRVALFVESGPSFRFLETTQNRDDFYTGTPAYHSTYDTDFVQRAIAVDLNLGFEWLFSKRLSLGARYGAFADYSWGSQVSIYLEDASDGSYYRLERERTKPKGVDVNTKRATVTLAAYF
jgi:hypothetical protein